MYIAIAVSLLTTLILSRRRTTGNEHAEPITFILGGASSCLPNACDPISCADRGRHSFILSLLLFSTPLIATPAMVPSSNQLSRRWAFPIISASTDFLSLWCC